MKKICIVSLTIVFLLQSLSAAAFSPQLKYACAGTYKLWTEESYYASPVIEDIDGDGMQEIIFSNYSITVLDAATGRTEWKVNSGYDRKTPVQEFGASNGHTWCTPKLYDIDGNGTKEIITGHGHGVVSVLDANGYFMPGWPQKHTDFSVRSVHVADLERDGKAEIIVGVAADSHRSVYVYNYDGTLRPGWPQTQGENGEKTWIYGVFMDTIETADLNGDGTREIIVPSDLSFVSVFESDGSVFMTNERVFGKKSWGQVSLFEDYSTEIRGDNGGWGFPVNGTEYREDLYKGEFGHAKAVVEDLDGNGTPEVIVPTVMCNRKYAPAYPPTEHMTVAIFNADRTRYKNEALGYDWEVLPMDMGAPLVHSNVMITSGIFQSPTISDLDGDGKKEILWSDYSGKMRCISLDKTEPYAWPYSLTKRTSPMYEYASPAVCCDLDGDGKQEVIFTSFYDESVGYGIVRGSLYILNYEGKLISKTQLPDTKEAGKYANGSKAAPAIGDIDGDGRPEIVVNTLHGAICAYDL